MTVHTRHRSLVLSIVICLLVILGPLAIAAFIWSDAFGTALSTALGAFGLVASAASFTWESNRQPRARTMISVFSAITAGVGFGLSFLVKTLDGDDPVNPAQVLEGFGLSLSVFVGAGVLVVILLLIRRLGALPEEPPTSDSASTRTITPTLFAVVAAMALAAYAGRSRRR